MRVVQCRRSQAATVSCYIMRIITYILLIVLTLQNCYGQKLLSSQRLITTESTINIDSTSKTKLVETIITDLNNDNKLDTIFLTKPPVIGDPGGFQKVIISLNGYNKSSYTAKEIWDNLDSLFLLENKNEIKSKRVFVFKNLKHSYILLFGYGFGTGREFTVIQVKDNIIKKIFDDQLDEPIKIKTFRNDNEVELLGRNGGEIYETVDSLDADIGVYSPYYIYNLNNNCNIDLELTKKYNEDNYVWAGLKYSEKIKVLNPRKKGKHRIIK